MPANTIYVGRPSEWGNPFSVAQFGDAQRCVNLFRRWLTGRMGPSGLHALLPGDQNREARVQLDLGSLHKRHRVSELRGKNLACWCPLDKPCHADVLLELANGKVP